MQIEVTFNTYIFLREFMKIIFQEKKIEKLKNYKILDELIEYIKSEIG
jgi:mannitol/fructose-specific phosphotransferase system IIA component (Ntr-type)